MTVELTLNETSLTAYTATSWSAVTCLSLLTFLLVTTAKPPDTVIANPACPSDTERSLAIGVRRLTGRNSNP
ncbi:hypothetical protein AB9E11_36465, partial [Rhizobium leguminosarum]